jgi:hypothetical protein
MNRQSTNEPLPSIAAPPDVLMKCAQCILLVHAVVIAIYDGFAEAWREACERWEEIKSEVPR